MPKQMKSFGVPDRDEGTWQTCLKTYWQEEQKFSVISSTDQAYFAEPGPNQS